MKPSPFLIFFSIFLIVYGSVNYYIFIRGWQALPKLPMLRVVYVAVSLFLIIAYIAGRILERHTPCAFNDILIWAGSFWIGIMTYLLLGILLLDILRASNHFFHFFPSLIMNHYKAAKLFASVVIVSVAVLVVIIGQINARAPVVKKLELKISKNAGTLKSLKIALATDIHLGRIISNSRLEKMVKTINGLSPDIILLGGDIVDEDLRPVVENNLGETLAQLKSRYGTYAITGNHEYIGGVVAAAQYLEDHGIIMLRDEVIRIDHKFYIIGREDISMKHFAGKDRKPLEYLLSGIDCKLPVIQMDHQPFSLKRVADTCIDLQVSGHTHHGQLWPYNFITSLIYEISHGYTQIGDTHFYVSSGYGTWGPPVRTTARPEIVEITLHLEP
jgi:predicted MPP superfamily phosphohydrolase